MTRAKTSPLLTTRYGIAAPTTRDTPAARSLQLYGEWAEQETDLLSGVVTDGHHVVEVGGDHAAHTLWLARAVGDTGAVHVIEPDRLPFQHLCANLALNQIGNVFAHHASPGTRMPAHLAEERAGRTMSVDSLALPALHLLKINLADALLDVLAGAKDTVRDQRPLIYARLGSADVAEAEVDAVRALGYRVWSHVPYLFNPANHAGAARNMFPGIVLPGIIASPTDADLDFAHLTEL